MHSSQEFGSVYAEIQHPIHENQAIKIYPAGEVHKMIRLTHLFRIRNLQTRSMRSFYSNKGNFSFNLNKVGKITKTKIDHRCLPQSMGD